MIVIFATYITIGQTTYTLNKYIEDMKAQFIGTRLQSPDGHDIDSEWQSLYPKHFIDLLLIQRDKQDMTEVARVERDGLMHYDDSILILLKDFGLIDDQHYKKFEAISDMFKSFKSEDGSIIEPKLILIDGATGMGKTTLCKEIACQWAKGELLKDTKIVFLLFLRDPAVQNMHNLNELIQYCFNFEPSDLDLDLTTQFVKTHSSNITILMDGYDELRNKGDNLLIENIIKRKTLPQCRIVITSRPIASENLQKLTNITVEIRGFTDESKRKYIQKELKPRKAEYLLSYLHDHGDINKACYMPLMMTTMVCIFKHYEELPTNESEIYERFVILAISRCLQKLDDKLPKGILSFRNLPVKYQTYVEQISEFAFKTIESDNIIFSNLDIERLSPNLALSIKGLDGLGLLKETGQFSFKMMENCVWYNFLHLSIHEFLAASYLKSHSPSEQFKILKQTFFIKHYYTNVWKMFVGLQQNVVHNFHHLSIYGESDAAKHQMIQNLYLLNFFEIRNIINNIRGTFQFLCCKNDEESLQNDVMQESFIKTFDSQCLLPFTFNWIKLYISLCSVANSDQLIEIYLLDKNEKSILYHQVVAGLRQDQNLSVMLVSSKTLVGYRCNYHQLSNAPNVHGSLENIILRYCLIGEDIAKILSPNLIKLHNLKCVHITDCIVKSALWAIQEDLTNVFKMNSGLRSLYLQNNNLGPSAAVILQALKENSQLRVLNLSNNNMTEQVAEELVNVIKNNSGLEELYLSNNDLRSSAIVILQALKENSKLKVLSLNNTNMIRQGVEYLPSVIKNSSNLYLYLGPSATMILQALKQNSPLKALSLNNNNMTRQEAELVNVIKNNSGLEELHLSNNDLRSSAIVILQALKENSQLNVLDLNGNNMTGQVAEDLAKLIKNNLYLEQLGLENNSLGPSATVILQALKENSQLKVLDLDGNNMTGQVSEDLANVIKTNSGLVKLYLSNNDLRSSATVILQALKENSQLKVLYLHGNNMTGQVAEDLAKVIKNNLYLEQLGLENNSLGPSATVILQALKENSQLKVLDLDGNNMTGQVSEDLANVIKTNSGLAKLHLSNNDLRSSATVILQALKENSQLKVLNLNSNNMTGQVAEDLAKLIKIIYIWNS